MNTNPPEVFDLGTDELASESALDAFEQSFAAFSLPEQRRA